MTDSGSSKRYCFALRNTATRIWCSVSFSLEAQVGRITHLPLCSYMGFNPHGDCKTNGLMEKTVDSDFRLAISCEGLEMRNQGSRFNTANGLIALVVLSACACAGHAKAQEHGIPARPHSFTVDGDHFALDGKPCNAGPSLLVFPVAVHGSRGKREHGLVPLMT